MKKGPTSLRPLNCAARAYATLLLASLLSLSGVPAISAQEPVAKDQTPAPSYTSSAEILPSVELLSGVLAHTSWIKQRGPEGQGHTYFQKLKKHFEPYRDHRAIRLAENMVQHGFVYDAHTAFAVRLGPLPALELRYDYPEQLVGRIKGGAKTLEEFRLALRDLAKESDFAAFWEAHQTNYRDWKNAAAFDQTRAQQWLEAFFGRSGNEFHLVLAPAMFPAGGYSATVKLDGDRQGVYQIVRSRPRGDTPAFGRPQSLEGLSVHEWGHSFVNPAVKKHRELIAKLEPHFAAVREEMKKQAYSIASTYVCEQVLRACEVVAMRERSGQAAAEKLIAYEEQRGFLLTRAAVQSLEKYIADRKKHPTFDTFVPILLADLAQEPVCVMPEPTPKVPEATTDRATAAK